MPFLPILVLAVIWQFSGTSSYVDAAQETGGVGCDALVAAYAKHPIPGTGLTTGTFYQIQMEYRNYGLGGGGGLDLGGGGGRQGFVTWASKRDKNGAKLVYTDYNNLSYYSKGGRWYKDTFWAFLQTKQPGWYNVINCGFPYKYLTWSNSSNDILVNHNDQSGRVLVLEKHYPGGHSMEDFLIKPIYFEQNHAYQLAFKSFPSKVVFESSSKYYEKSYYLKVDTSPTYAGWSSSERTMFWIGSPLEEQRDSSPATPESLCNAVFGLLLNRNTCY